MMSLDIDKQKAEQLNKLEDEALGVLIGVMKGGLVDDQAKMAVSAMGIVSKARGNQSTRDGLRFNMVKFVADREEMKKYVSATQPEIRKLIGSKKKTK